MVFWWWLDWDAFATFTKTTVQSIGIVICGYAVLVQGVAWWAVVVQVRWGGRSVVKMVGIHFRHWRASRHGVPFIAGGNLIPIWKFCFPLFNIFPFILIIFIVIFEFNNIKNNIIIAKCFSAADLAPNDIKKPTFDQYATNLSKVVNPSKLKYRGHAVQEATDDEPVQGCGIVHLRQI